MNNYRPEISQEEFEEIESYLLGSLTLSQREDFEKRMESDAVLREEVLLQQKLMTGVELGAIDKGFKKSSISEAKIIKIFNRKVWLVAAGFVGIVLLSFIVYFFIWESNSNTGSDLYAAYFYPDPGLPVVMSSTENYEFYDGMVSYKEGKYEEAMTIWSRLPASLVESDTLRYYQGVALMNLDKLDESITYLDLVTSDPQSEFRAKAIWYQALIHVRQNEIGKAIELLEKIASELRAQMLLEDLRKSP